MEALPDKPYSAHYDLALAYLGVGRIGEAVAELEAMLSSYEEARVTSTPIVAVKAHYLLAKAYEESGWHSKAIEQYEKFLQIWKDADPGIEEVGDARERLTNLKGEA